MQVVSVNVGLPRNVRWRGPIERLVALDALPEDWQRYVAKRLAALSTTTAN